MIVVPELILHARDAHARLHHRDPQTGKKKPLCLACGQPATNCLPSCNEKKCRRLVRPIFRWAKRVAEIATPAALRRSL